MSIQETNRNEAFEDLDVKKSQLNNCLIPLWLKGNATAQEIAEFIELPINSVTGRVKEMFDRNYIAISPYKPSKKNPKTGKKNTNYILTVRGKRAVWQLRDKS